MELYQGWISGMTKIVLRGYDNGDIGLEGHVTGYEEPRRNGFEVLLDHEYKLGEDWGDQDKAFQGKRDIWQWAGCANPIAEAKGVKAQAH